MAKLLLLCLLLCLNGTAKMGVAGTAKTSIAGTAKAAPPLERYLAVRDRHIDAIDRAATAQGPGSVSEAEERARRDLETMLKDLVGSVAVAGLPAEGRSNLETLVKELGFGKLDGLVHGQPDTGRSAVVTTKGLLKAWLKGHRNWWPGHDNVPQDIAGALRSEAFYTQAVGTGAAFATFAEIPVAAPRKAGFLSVLLAVTRQDIGPWMPNEIILSAVRGDRVYIVREPAAATVAPIPACTALWERYDRERRRALDAYRPTETKRDRALFARATRLEAEGDVAHRRCFARHVGEQDYFPALVRQAQALADGLP